MAEILLSIATKVMEYLVEPTIQQGQYLFCAHKFIEDLEDKKKKLTLTKENVQNRIKEAKKKTENFEKAVENWLNEVTNLLAEVENLQQEMNENRSCCQGWNPNWIRYNLCRQMAKKTKSMMELNNNSKFEIFARLSTLPSVDRFSGRNFIYFESTQSASNQLLEAIQDDESYMIGLYGMGGCGKTSLVKEVGKKTTELNLFDQVAFITVSQTPNIRRIQGEIADFLGLKLGEETEAGRASRISLKLQSGERILVILDDVWARLNLVDIGIPFFKSHGACEVLLTTRRRQVCTLMECQRKIRLYLLSEEEAMVLLKKHAKIDDDSSPSLLNELACGVLKECKGLPLAIEVVGTSLREKSIDDWKIALDRLKHSKPIDVEEGIRDVFACLQLSYDYLGSRVAKSLLLTCSLFPEDYEILIEDLFKFTVGIGLCEEFESFDIARSQVNASVKKLVDSSLLMHPQVRVGSVMLQDTVTDYDICRTLLDGTTVSWYEERKERVKMHDMVRDLAIWIASKEGHAMKVNPVRDLETKATDCFAVSLWNKKIPDQMDAPKLEILLMHSDSESFLELSDGSFEGMKALKVMTISGGNHSLKLRLHLPQPTHLTNLRILRLVRLRLDDISTVISLRMLEILDLNESRFKELPNAIDKLSRLKLLDLSWCTIEEGCYKVIGRCSQLEELYASGLNMYRRSINSFEFLRDDDAFPKLQRYSIEIGGKGVDLVHMVLCNPSHARLLHIEDFNAYTSGATIKDLLQRSEAVSIDNLQGSFNNLIPETVQVIGGFNELNLLILSHCSEMECLIDTSSDQAESFPVAVVLPRLVTLILTEMDDMKEVCRGPPPLGFFEKLEGFLLNECSALQSIFPRECNLCNLRSLTITSCPTLISLFPISVAQTLVQLQELTIVECYEMNEIIATEGENGITDTENSRSLFPKLRIIFVDQCHKLECIFPISCVEGLLQLESLKITNSSCMKSVFGQREHDIHTYSQNDIHIKLPILKRLRLESLPNLLSIFPDNYESSLPPLKHLICDGCPNLTLPDDVSAIQE